MKASSLLSLAVFTIVLVVLTMKSPPEADPPESYLVTESQGTIQEPDSKTEPGSKQFSSSSQPSVHPDAEDMTARGDDDLEAEQPYTITFRGSIQSEFGAVSINETIRLYSKSVNRGYTTDSDTNGDFSFDDVIPADDYRLTVAPAGMFKRVVMESLDIESDRTELLIVLESLPFATLKGRVTNSDGISVPGYTLKVQSPKKARWIANVTTDVVGEFLVEKVPVGALEFTKTFGTALIITGYEFQGDQQPPLVLVVDTGPYEVSGTVYDQFNDPVAGATVILSWELTNGKKRVRVNRRDATNPSGHFSIRDVGRGEHDLLITAGRNFIYQQVVNVGIDSTDLSIILYQNPRSQ